MAQAPGETVLAEQLSLALKYLTQRTLVSHTDRTKTDTNNAHGVPQSSKKFEYWMKRGRGRKMGCGGTV